MKNPITVRITPRKRFEFLKTMYRAAPLPDAEKTELKKLAQRYDKKYAEWMDENPELV